MVLSRTQIERDLLRLELRDEVEIDVATLGALLQGLDYSYRVLWWLAQDDHSRRPEATMIPDAEVLKIERIRLGSPGVVDLSGLGEPIRELRELIKDILAGRIGHEKDMAKLERVEAVQRVMREAHFDEGDIREVTAAFLRQIGEVRKALDRLDVRSPDEVVLLLEEATGDRLKRPVDMIDFGWYCRGDALSARPTQAIAALLTAPLLDFAYGEGGSGADRVVDAMLKVCTENKGSALLHLDPEARYVAALRSDNIWMSALRHEVGLSFGTSVSEGEVWQIVSVVMGAAYDWVAATDDDLKQHARRVLSNAVVVALVSWRGRRT